MMTLFPNQYIFLLTKAASKQRHESETKTARQKKVKSKQGKARQGKKEVENGKAREKKCPLFSILLFNTSSNVNSKKLCS
jgi:hypothetical protein